MVRHNHIGIWVLVVAHFLFTILWYSPLLFHFVWIEAQERDLSKPTKDSLPYVTGVVASIILCYAISWLVQVLGKDTFKKGFLLGVLIFFGFSASTIAPHYKYLDVSTLVLFVDLGLTFCIITLTSGILAIWKKNED